MITKKDLMMLGSTDPIKWMQESMDQIKIEFDELYKKGMNIIHINTQDIDSFKKSIEQYSKDHPEAKIQAAGFMLSTEDPSKNKEFTHKSKSKKGKK